MQLYVLVVNGKGDTPPEVFYFDSHPAYLRARSEAIEAGRFGGGRETKTTSLEGFREWMKE